MKILAVNSSPRPNKNTASLMRMIVESAKKEGSSVNAMWCNLNDMAYSGCQSCLACKQPEVKSCVRKDSLAFVLDVMLASQSWVIGTPVYMGQASGQLKLVLDRMYGFIGPNGENRIPPGKKVVIVITQKHGKEHHKDFEMQLKEFLSNRGVETKVIRACDMPVKASTPEFCEEIKKKAASLGRWLVTST